MYYLAVVRKCVFRILVALPTFGSELARHASLASKLLGFLPYVAKKYFETQRTFQKPDTKYSSQRRRELNEPSTDDAVRCFGLNGGRSTNCEGIAKLGLSLSRLSCSRSQRLFGYTESVPTLAYARSYDRGQGS